MHKLGMAAARILLLLGAGVALGFSYSPSRYRKVLKILTHEWEALNRRDLYRAIQRLYQSKLIGFKEREDGAVDIVLSREGEKIALRYKLDEMQIAKPKRWDTKWRVIIFDVPEKKKRLRDAIRMHFRRLGLVELQKSVFVHPFDCQNEIDFLIELFDARPYVRFIEANHIDNELHLKKKFKLV